METILEILQNLVADYTQRTVAIGGLLIGITAGSLGCFLVLRRQSLFADSVSHAVLPGLVLAYMIFQVKEPLYLVIGAIIAGWVASYFFFRIIHQSRVKPDSALGIILAVFFGLGILLLVILDKGQYGSHSGIKDYIFGKAAGIVMNDVYIISIFGGLVILVVLLLWKEFKLLIFNPDFGKTIGLPVGIINTILTSITVVAIVIGLQMIGVVLMSAMVIGPAVAARQWTNRLSTMIILSASFGGVSGVIGAVISSLASKLSTGPIIILCVTFFVVISILFSPRRGVIYLGIMKYRQKIQFTEDTLLLHIYTHKDQYNNQYTRSILNILSKRNMRQILSILNRLTRKNLLSSLSINLEPIWSLTEAGMVRAQSLSHKGL